MIRWISSDHVTIVLWSKLEIISFFRLLWIVVHSNPAVDVTWQFWFYWWNHVTWVLHSDFESSKQPKKHYSTLKHRHTVILPIKKANRNPAISSSYVYIVFFIEQIAWSMHTEVSANTVVSGWRFGWWVKAANTASSWLPQHRVQKALKTWHANSSAPARLEVIPLRGRLVWGDIFICNQHTADNASKLTTRLELLGCQSQFSGGKTIKELGTYNNIPSSTMFNQLVKSRLQLVPT